MKHAVISGGCGFVGHHFCEHALATTDWRLTIIDGLTYAGDASRITNLSGYTRDRVKIVWHDLRSPISDELVEKIGNVDFIVNIASESHVDRSIAQPITFIHNNVMLMLHMLEFARTVKPTTFIHIGTDEIYGPAPDSYFFKEWDRHIPSNPYSASKSSQEACAIAYWRTYGVPIILIATMNNFGERQNKEKFIPKCVDHLLTGKSMPIHAIHTRHGWVSGSRVWLHAKNHADALCFLLNNTPAVYYPESDRPAKYHIAGDQELSNLDIFIKIAAILNVDPKFEFIDAHSQRPGHDLRYALDGRKLTEAGWRPPIPFDESLTSTVLSFSA